MTNGPGALEVVLAAAAVVAMMMLAELALSRSNERRLRSKGAIEPADDVYPEMTWVYPASFVVMSLEGAVFGPRLWPGTVIGVVVFTLSKSLKYWAIASLGPQWSFRVLVVPGAPLVTRGPYAWLRHPNYLALIGEFVGFALVVGGFVTGAVAIGGFGWLIRRRIIIEERALGIVRCPQ